MALEPKLLDLFLAELSEEHRTRLESPGRIAELLAQQLDAATDRWPDLGLDPAEFIAAVASRLPVNLTPEQGLSQLHAADLFLARSCARGNDVAIAQFEAQHFRCIDGVAAQLKLSPHAAEEVKQTLRVQLFVASGGSEQNPPLVANYSGRGSLRNWLRIIAVRTAGKLMDQGRREVLLTDSVLDGLAPADQDPELDFLKRTYRGEFRAAFQAALQSLSPRERNLLGHHFVDRLNIDEIGALYSVHRATAARWLVKAREALLGHTRAELMRRIEIDRVEYDSIMRLIESQLPVSFPALPVEDGE
jgi:RNA polymerase sigma-70 factor (ECF subfamily)